MISAMREIKCANVKLTRNTYLNSTARKGLFENLMFKLGPKDYRAFQAEGTTFAKP